MINQNDFESYCIHEVHYAEDGSILGWTENAIAVCSDLPAMCRRSWRSSRSYWGLPINTGCYERDLGRQPYAGRFVGEPHRCRTRPRCRHPHFFLGLLPRRNSDHNRNSCDWRMVAKLNFWVHSFRPQWIHRQSLTSARGPSRKSHDVRFLVAIGVKADLSRASNFVGYYARDSEWSARIKKTPHQNSKSLARFSV